MKTMCDLTQFVVSILVEEATSEMMEKLFIEQIVFTFRMVAIVIVDAGSKFLVLFEEMCRVLGFKFWPLLRDNHKGNSVENTTDF